MDQNYLRVYDIADLLYSGFIRYERLYEMTKYAFYGKTDSNNVDIYIDAYSILKVLYSRGPSLQVKDSCVIASCLINLAIHLRAYFESRHNVCSKVYIIYGGARPRSALTSYPRYNEKNILMEESDSIIKNLIIDNLNIVKILCPYLYDIFCVVDMENEFSVIASSLIDESENPRIIYSKESLAYQLVAFKPMTFLYRPKKSMNQDNSWVVTKSSLYNAYRYGELKLKKQIDTQLNPKTISIYQAISGVRSRSMNSLKNANSTITILTNAIASNIFSNGYNANSILHSHPFEDIFGGTNVNPAEVVDRFKAIDLPYQTMLYKSAIEFKDTLSGLINLYDPQEVRNINDKYFRRYPLDLNRV